MQTLLNTLSLLRYPGGKTRLRDFIKENVIKNHCENGTYIEPFAGGFSVGLYLLENNIVEKIVLNDYDPGIHAFWYNVLNEPEKFIQKIRRTDATLEQWYKQKKILTKDKLDPYSRKLGFAAMFLNRTNRSGILNAGPIGGYNQNGDYKLDCRYNKQTLIQKINDLKQYKDRIIIKNEDALTLIQNIEQEFDPNKTFLFIDPPYYQKGHTLYDTCLNKEQHKQLSEIIINHLKNYQWILTYDNDETIKQYYQDEAIRIYNYSLNYTVQNKRKEIELLITNKNTQIQSTNKIKVNN